MAGNILNRARQILEREARRNVERVEEPCTFVVYGVFLGHPSVQLFGDESSARRWIAEVEQGVDGSDRLANPTRFEMDRWDGVDHLDIEWDASNTGILYRGAE